MNDQPNNPPDGLEKLLRQWGARRAVEEAPLPAAPRPQQRGVLTLTARWAPLAAAAVLLIVAGVLYRASLIEYGAQHMEVAERPSPEKSLLAPDADADYRKKRLVIEPASPASPRPVVPRREPPPDVAPPQVPADAVAPSPAPRAEARRREAPPQGPGDAGAVARPAAREAGETRSVTEAGLKDAPDAMMDEGRDEGDRRSERDKASAGEREDAFAREREVLKAQRDKLAVEVTELRRQLAQADGRTEVLRRDLNRATEAMTKLEQAQQFASLDTAAEVAPAEALELAADKIPERARKDKPVGVDVAAELVTLYLTTVAPNETGMAGVQAVARNRLLIRRCGELRRRVGETETGRVIERLEVVLTRLALLDVEDASEVEAFAAATRTGSLRAMLAIARQQAEDEQSRLVLLEIQLILLGVDRVA